MYEVMRLVYLRRNVLEAAAVAQAANTTHLLVYTRYYKVYIAHYSH